MRASKFYSIGLISLGILVRTVDSGFPLVFPFLTTGWYYKPGPVEAIFLGLIVVKVLALRLGATVAGVPYHLNDIFDKSSTKFTLPWNSARGKRETWKSRQTFPLTQKEIQTLERILLALRRIDSHSCFIRYICQVNQNHLAGKNVSSDDETWLNILKLRPITTSREKNKSSFSIWNIYEDALGPNIDCGKKYSECPLTDRDVQISNLLDGLF